MKTFYFKVKTFAFTSRKQDASASPKPRTGILMPGGKQTQKISWQFRDVCADPTQWKHSGTASRGAAGLARLSGVPRPLSAQFSTTKLSSGWEFWAVPIHCHCSTRLGAPQGFLLQGFNSSAPSPRGAQNHTETWVMPVWNLAQTQCFFVLCGRGNPKGKAEDHKPTKFAEHT